MMKTLKLGPFLGVNNRRPDFSLVPEPLQSPKCFVRLADNFDVDNAGRFVRRRGSSLLQAMTGVHSIFTTSLTTGFLVRASTLYAITLPIYTETLLKVLSNDNPVSYVEMFGDVYFSNETDAGRISSGVVYPIGLPTPDAPAVEEIVGTLLPGHYQVAVGYVNSVTGEEGGVSASANHELTATQGLRVTLPGVTVGATHVAIYLSTCNGSVPRFLALVVANTPLYDCTVLAAGREAQQRYDAPLPAGRLFTSNGRLCSMKDSTVYVGLPFRPGYYLPAEGYIPFPSTVTNAVENQGGTYITSDATYWIPGDIGDSNAKEIVSTVLPYGAVQGTVFSVPDKTLVGWFGEKGVVLGKANGEVEAVMSDNVDQTPPATGLATVFESQGYRRVMSCGWSVNLQTLAATSYSDWNFTSVSGGYATRADGIYTVDTDDDVDAVIGFGKQDFGVEFEKRLLAGYFGVMSPTAAQLRVKTAGGVDKTYQAQSYSTDLKIQRIITGKGILAAWFDLFLMNTEGSDLTVATASFMPAATRRR